MCPHARKEVREQLSVELATQSANQLHNKLLHNKLLEDKLKRNKADVDAGNRVGAYSLPTLQKISSEMNSKDDKSKDVLQALTLEAAEANEKYGEGSVFLLSHNPFGVAWCTKNQAVHHLKSSEAQNPSINYLDATGSCVAPPPWSSQKSVLNYTLSTKDPQKPPIIVTEFVSNDQHEHTIRNWLARWKFRYFEAVESKVLPFKIIVTDMSFALSNSVLLEFSGMSMSEYLKQAVLAKDRGSMTCVMLAWCYAHVNNAIVKNVKEWLPLKSKKYSPARVFVKFAVAHIARSSSLEEALQIWEPFVLVVSSHSVTPAVKAALEEIGHRFKGDEILLDEEEGLSRATKVNTLNFV